MALVIDATPGGANANSFCTLVEAESYHESRLDNAAWDAATDPDKTSALVWATRTLNRLEWLGSIETQTQALRWPRTGVSDQDDREVTGVPSFLKNATAELAFKYIKDGSASETRLMEKIKVGSITLDYGDVTQEGADLPDEVFSMISYYAKLYGKSVNIVRG